MEAHIILPARFNGPPSSANGGYACGAVAALIDGPARVTLRSPPPLDTPLEVIREGERVTVRHGERVVATAAPVAPVALEVPDRVSPVAASSAGRGYAGFDWHPFATCFVCGPQRAEGDGLRIFPGAVEGRPIVAAPWRPHASICDAGGEVEAACVWASLDCPTYFGAAAARPGRTMAVLGRHAVRIDARPRAGEQCVLTSWSLGEDGRKLHAGAALRSESRGLLAVAQATWILIG